jgi:hypothetical protein
MGFFFQSIAGVAGRSQSARLGQEFPAGRNPNEGKLENRHTMPPSSMV